MNDIKQVLDSINSLIDNGVNIFLLSGNVGVGKTFLVKEFAKTKGITQVNSPTFSFIHEYASLDSKIFHYDLYLKNTQDSKAKLLESLSLEGIHFIEWGDKSLAQTLQSLGFCVSLVEITESSTKDSRIYTIISIF
ncbi:tRNA (adenosine(37)-N6)-threonylcarbamoyltransferase complex ATPase subunit type 1 TsaE [Helicobacter saguini]|uniref:tRNA threonylcarbamoyladenosine biosynthesis protein TsaE n=1 Tax=Helicobacter saguini TaxID=1548018 RepID=A0A347VQ33_9HELI|nr:tRNA (adenosine(37)-N6)-threonylcarbamoyltransferase complex ATPase subunit type 1 TsaE [Helicobacter saguini]MWV61100.1 tRNA (adenosine(37)-N6)-threonylcarbamoyltransferase complex ATPase subunit type 1 TsaE [Helicobacter saguini]MWV68231.1 tRNA (adenosine(37)-N6)-threonylcarbamoyltransferase complex ATPase subunit type 1 TsaE [Helicobacter saguini]MWV70305.1 tRNA (adenosine(37)-N6)-threonylcarbamoyltransferase complex ATPase subunit type 1 TsaE [Helicobacter saguini]MWV72207.1 tRNA (adenos